jgi:hypothetical protein
VQQIPNFRTRRSDPEQAVAGLRPHMKEHELSKAGAVDPFDTADIKDNARLPLK